MARSRSLVQLRADVRTAADIGNALTRWPNATLDRLINESIQELRELVSENGHDYYLKVSASVISAGDDRITMDSDFLRVKGIDIDVNGESVALEEFQLSERNAYGGTLVTGAERGTPVAYRLVQGNDIPGNIPDVEALLMPVSDRTYPYRVWYLPAWQDLVDDGDLFDGVADWERWVVWDVCCKIGTTDKNVTLFQMASSERDKKRAAIEKKSHRRAAGPARRLDTRAMRSLDSRRRNPPWWT